MSSKIKVKKVLLQHFQGSSIREIARMKVASTKSASDVIKIASKQGLTKEQVEVLSEEEVYKLIYPEKWTTDILVEKIDFEYIHKELKRPGVTLKLLYNEYKDECRLRNKLFVSYTSYCRRYSSFTNIKGYANHLVYAPAAKVEVDYAGKTMYFRDPYTNKRTTVYLFVACLPYSRLIFVDPCLNMTQYNWLQSHIKMFKYFGGATRAIVPDNLRNGVNKHPKEGEIVLNHEYESLAEHYMCGILPTQIKSPRQKNNVENSVWSATMDVIAKLRNQEFSNYKALKAAVEREVEAINNKPFQAREGSRRIFFEENEKEYLRPLPDTDFEVGLWIYDRHVHPNSHITFEKNWYSVPHSYLGMCVDVKVGETSLYIFSKDGKLIKMHVRFESDGKKNKYRTDLSDLPCSPENCVWNEDRYRSWATTIGNSTEKVVDLILTSKPIVEQCYNSASAVLRLSKKYTKERLEVACKMALTQVPSPRYHNLKAILESEQDIEYSKEKTRIAQNLPGLLRGKDFYSNKENEK